MASHLEPPGGRRAGDRAKDEVEHPSLGEASRRQDRANRRIKVEGEAESQSQRAVEGVQ